MRIGTKSVLFGAHCFFIHPWFVAWGWYKMYGFPWDPRLWVAFFVHDLGYWGKPNMDGEEGEMHPLFGANVMHYLFDKPVLFNFGGISNQDVWEYALKQPQGPFVKDATFWFRMTYYHSRFLSKREKVRYSPFCVADKMAICLEPSWLYLPRVILSGEIKEYIEVARNGRHGVELDLETRRSWHRAVKEYCLEWCQIHRNGDYDTWTPEPLNELITT